MPTTYGLRPSWASISATTPCVGCADPNLASAAADSLCYSRSSSHPCLKMLAAGSSLASAGTELGALAGRRHHRLDSAVPWAAGAMGQAAATAEPSVVEA